MNNLNEMGIITVTSVTFYDGKNRVAPDAGVRSVMMNGKFASKGCSGYANVFITADEYNDKVAGRSVADVVQVLCLGETSETKTSSAGKTYIQVNVDDQGRKFVKVTDGDETVKTFTDETYPRVTVKSEPSRCSTLAV